MPSRREFIRSLLALSMAPVALPIRESANLTPGYEIVTPAHHRLHCIVSDVRSRWSSDFGREAERLGVRVVRTSGDITDLWFNDLSRRWRETPVAIAGLTAHGPLFCLERFGWDYGLRVVFRGTHRFLDTRCVEHEISGPTRAIVAAQDAGLTGAGWAGRLAHVLTSCVASRDTTSATVTGVVLTDHLGDLNEPLVSWMIAPKLGSET